MVTQNALKQLMKTTKVYVILMAYLAATEFALVSIDSEVLLDAHVEICVSKAHHIASRGTKRVGICLTGHLCMRPSHDGGTAAWCNNAQMLQSQHCQL
jgi:hypothetical protein